MSTGESVLFWVLACVVVVLVLYFAGGEMLVAAGE